MVMNSEQINFLQDLVVAALSLSRQVPSISFLKACKEYLFPLNVEDEICFVIAFKAATAPFWVDHDFDQNLALQIFFGEENIPRNQLQGQQEQVMESMTRLNPFEEEEIGSTKWRIGEVDLSAAMKTVFLSAKAKATPRGMAFSSLGETLVLSITNLKDLSLFEELALSSVIFLTFTTEGKFLKTSSKRISLHTLSTPEKNTIKCYIDELLPVLPSTTALTDVLAGKDCHINEVEKYFVHRFETVYTSNFNYEKEQEGQIINQVILPFLEDVFLDKLIKEEGNLIYDKSQTTKQHWPIGDDSAMMAKADFGMQTVLGEHMVLVAEVKTSENKLTHDLKKLAFCMKASMDRAQQLGVLDAAVCGLWVQGLQFRGLYMDQLHDGGYRLVEVHFFKA